MTAPTRGPRGPKGPLQATRGPLQDALAAERTAFVTVGAFSLFINLAALTVPLYMLQVYDRVLVSQSRETLTMLTLLAVGLLGIVTLVEIARSRLLVRIGASLDERLGSALFGTAVERRAAGEEAAASQPLRDLESLRTFLTGSGVLALLDAPWTPIYLAIVWLFHPLLGAIATAGALAILGIAAASEYAVRDPLREAGASTRWSNDLIDIFARNARAIRVMGMLGRLQTLWHTHRRDGLMQQAVASDRLGVLQAGAKSMRQALQVAILGAGAWLVLENATTAGVMIAASIVMGRALAPVEAALGQWRGFLNARGAYQRLTTVLDQEGAAPERMELPVPVGRIEVDNVGLRLSDRAPLLSGIAFSMVPGELLGLIGPTGAGKSSLARLLIGLDPPTLGHVRLDGVEMSSWPKEEVGPHLGYLPQEIELPGGTVAQNICRFGEVDTRAVVEAARLAGAHEMILRLPEGYETVIENGGANLAGGQRQRIGLARAFFGRPRFIVLDEPNANLDAQGEAALVAALAALKRHGRTVIVITHKPSILRGADRLLVLGEGRIHMLGPPEQVIAEMARTATRRPEGRPEGRSEGRSEGEAAPVLRVATAATGTDHASR